MTIRNSAKCFLLLILLIASSGLASERPVGFVEPTTGMEFVFVKGGDFFMGSDAADAKRPEGPRHRVRVSSFYIGRTEVTQKQWETLMKGNAASTKGDSLPIDNVSWYGAQRFLRALRQATGRQFRLPTEAEWEYAARSGGKEEEWPGTSDLQAVDGIAWHGRNSGGQLQGVGLKTPNGLGLFDMAGNVFEWCRDVYAIDYYQRSPVDNPHGDEAGTVRVMRGGGFFTSARGTRTTFRYRAGDKHRYRGYGFRVVLPDAN